ncbi:MAG: hypothetical protein ABI580_07760 [Burkholderiaceae bacterium]
MKFTLRWTRYCAAIGDPPRITAHALFVSALLISLSVTEVTDARAAPTAPAPVALVVLVEGDVQVSKWPLPLHHTAAIGETVVLARGGKVALLYPQEARLWTLQGPGKVRVAAKAPEALDKHVRVESRALPAVYREVEVGNGHVAQGALVLRAGTPIRITGSRMGLWLEPRGELQWSAPAWARKFEVEVSRSDGTVIQTYTTHEPRLQIADLQQGAAYSVRVEATDAAGRRQGDTIRFTVAEDQRARELLAARPAPDADPQGRAAYEALLTAIASAAWR